MHLDRHVLIWAVVGLLLLRLVDSEEETIMDTRNATSDLNWPTSGVGWAELTGDDGSDADLRTFQICRIKSPNQNNWIRTPYLEVGNAQRVFVEIRFAIRSCEGMSKIVSCKETFNLYYIESDGVDDARASRMNALTYTKVDTIAADDRFSKDSTEANTETRMITHISSGGIYLAIQDTGACMTIFHVRVYQKICPETIRRLAWFPVTNTGPKLTSLVDVYGVCVANSVRMSDAPGTILHCNSEGQWSVPSGGCNCEPGYEPNRKLTECNECPVSKFKAFPGNNACGFCPLNSFTVDFASTSCRCRSGFYRAPGDRPDVPCTRPPSAPTTAESVVNKTEVTLTWSEPSDSGGRVDVMYSVSCHKCDASYSICSQCSGRVDFIPKRTRLTRRKVLIRDLSPHTHYKLRIYASNGVSAVSKMNTKYAELKIETNQAAPPAVAPVRVLHTQARGVVLQWDAPSSSGSPVIGYQVLYSSVQGVHSNVTKTTTLKLGNLSPRTSYIVQVRARSKGGYGLYSRATAFRTKSEKATASPNTRNTRVPSNDQNNKNEDPQDDVTSPPSKSDHLIIAISVTFGLLLITLALLAVICSRRRGYVKTSSVDLEKYPGFINNTVDLVSTRSYIDPSTYEDPYIAVEEFTKEIEYNLISIDEVIGSGEFGEVCKGILAPDQVVAIKTLKVGYSSQEKLDFLGEASIMGQFEHPNVIRLEGVVTRSRPLMIITEYMENGSLDAYLRANEGKLTTIRLTMMLHDIASGMRYLTEMGYVHRDLAARNVLLDNQLVCKVSDFGLSRELEEVENEEVAMYTTRGGMIPIRWTAPEAITKRTFSSSSDVWSYGIVTWEVLSYGERPYWEMSNQHVVHFVESGYRLPAPCYCPQSLLEMMLECWNCNRMHRPTFNQLVALLSNLLQEPECLTDTINDRPYRDQDDCIPEMLDLSSLGHWLEQMYLLQYKPNLLRYGCVTAEQIMRLSASELQRMGINDANDVNTILREADLLRHKLEEVNTVGIAV